MPTSKSTPAERAEHPNLAAALAAFQAEMPTVHKGKTAKVPTKAGGSYSYDYADLADVAKVAHPILARHGLSFSARPSHVEGLGFVLVGVLRHESGESDEGLLPIQGRSAQEIGSSLTYNRRYLLGCMTGIVTDADDDGAIANAAPDARPRASQPSRQAGGQRQQGRAQAEAAPPAADQAPDVDPAVLKAQTLAVANAADLPALRAAYDEACRSGAIHVVVDDPDHDGNRVPLSELVDRRRTAMQASAA